MTEHLKNNPDDCITILEELGYHNINYVTSKNELRFSRIGGTNPSSVRLSLEYLKYICFSTDDKGNIYSLVMKNRSCSFPEALEWISKKLNISVGVLSRKIKAPFHGFYKKIIKEIEEPEFSMKTYDSDLLIPYSNKYNMQFLNDGIDFDTQRKFCIGYDEDTQRITVPEYTLSGELCGIMGRKNDLFCEKDERWLPIVPCSRSLTLYGYHYNYGSIQQKSLVVIGESEKFVQQLDSMGCHIGLGLCGCNISSIQAKHIKGLLTNKIILALDEGLDEDQIRSQAEKLIVNTPILKNKVGYIYDREHEILQEGSKNSPSDMGAEKFMELIKNKTIWMEV